MAEEKNFIKFVRGATLPEDKNGNTLYFKIDENAAGELFLGNKLIAKDHSAELKTIENKLGELDELIKNLPSCDCDGKYLLISSFNEYVAEQEELHTGLMGRVKTLEDQIKGLSGAMHFIGAVESDPMAEGFDVSGYNPGDVVVYEEKEYVFGKGGKFIELGNTTLTADQLAKVNEDIQAAQSTANEALTLVNGLGNSVESHNTAITDLQSRVSELERGGGGEGDYDHEALKQEILEEAAVAAKETIQGNTDVTVADCVVAINKMNGDLENTQSEIKDVHNFLDMFTWQEV